MSTWSREDWLRREYEDAARLRREGNSLEARMWEMSLAACDRPIRLPDALRSELEAMRARFLRGEFNQ